MPAYVQYPTYECLEARSCQFVNHARTRELIIPANIRKTDKRDFVLYVGGVKMNEQCYDATSWGVIMADSIGEGVVVRYQTKPYQIRADLTQIDRPVNARIVPNNFRDAISDAVREVDEQDRRIAAANRPIQQPAQPQPNVLPSPERNISIDVAPRPRKIIFDLIPEPVETPTNASGGA